MIFPTYSISLLSLLPFALAEFISYDVPPGKVINDTPGGLIGSAISSRHIVRSPSSSKPKSGPKPFQLRSFVPLEPPTRPLPRWIPRNINKLTGRSPQDETSASSLMCVANGPSCAIGSFCFNGLGCCQNGQTGCGGNSCCSDSQSCCPGGGCCPTGYNCITKRGNPGCCLDGSDCDHTGDVVYTVEGIADANDGGVCVNDGFGICPSRKFCCPAGRKCLRDINGSAACERGCENDTFFVCPSNDFCCPSGSQCFVDENGNNRCRVTVITTVTSTSRSATTSLSSSSTPASSSTPSSSSSTEQTSSSSTPLNSDIITGTVSVITSVSTPGVIQSTSSAVTTTAAADNNNGGPLPSPNGGLDNIFTDPDSSSTRNFERMWLSTAVVGFICVVVGWL